MCHRWTSEVAAYTDVYFQYIPEDGVLTTAEKLEGWVVSHLADNTVVKKKARTLRKLRVTRKQPPFAIGYEPPAATGCDPPFKTDDEPRSTAVYNPPSIDWSCASVKQVMILAQSENRL